jgi:hypothetical protein
MHILDTATQHSYPTAHLLARRFIGLLVCLMVALSVLLS